LTKTDFHSRLNMKQSEKERLEKFGLMSPDEVAEYSLKSLNNNRVICIPGRRKRLIAKLISLMPRPLYYNMLKKL
ncbi:MAG: NAD(P)-dependent oxidoreductase, partial [Marinilabiliales bacterium]